MASSTQGCCSHHWLQLSQAGTLAHNYRLCMASCKNAISGSFTLGMVRTIVFCTLLACTLAFAFSKPGFAMTFDTFMFGGILTVRGDGQIVSGDAEGLEQALKNAGRNELGMKMLTLNSDGGSVDAAMEMVTVMDDIGVDVQVLPGSRCASACASILFVSGRHHVVALGGALGFHSCYNGANKIPNDVCNENIAQNALDHGVQYGSVYVFMHTTEPSGMMWFGMAEANCWGLTSWPENMKPPYWNACVIKAMRKSGCNAGNEKFCNN